DAVPFEAEHDHLVELVNRCVLRHGAAQAARNAGLMVPSLSSTRYLTLSISCPPAGRTALKASSRVMRSRFMASSQNAPSCARSVGSDRTALAKPGERTETNLTRNCISISSPSATAPS